MKKQSIGNNILTIFLSVLSLAWVYPVVMILFNSLKKETAISTSTVFQLPSAETFAGMENYANAVGSKGFVEAFITSLIITVTSVVAILIFCSMCAWYITRVQNILTKAVYYLFVFSMVVPFQMLMFTLSATADKLNLNTPYNIWIIYLGFGAGHGLVLGEVFQGSLTDETFFLHSLSFALILQIIWVMVPMGQKLHQLLGFQRAFTARPMMVEVSIRL